MIQILKQVEKKLPALLKQEDLWQTLNINYEKPHVERVWCPWVDYLGNHYRINLHRIHPCEYHEAFFHPHPWASAMRILAGKYEMSVGYGRGLVTPPVAATLILEKGSMYEMTDPDSWHYVRPLDEPVMSLMITSYPWKRAMPKSDKVVLSTLSDEAKKEIIQYFRMMY